MKKLIAVVLILAGCALIFYPKGSDLYTAHIQKKLLNNWEKQTKVESYNKLTSVFTTEEGVQQEGMAEQSEEIVGTIQISKIDLKLPILEGATAENLEIAAGHLKGTAPLGKTGNSAIAAHRSRKDGMMFNRLDEVKAGDEIVVEDRSNKYIYTVYNTLIVAPDNLSVLQPRGDKKILTLITCHPIDTGTDRLIVQAELTENIPLDAKSSH